MKNQRLRSVLTIFIKISVTVGLIYLVSRKINLGDVKQLFLESNIYYTGLALVLYFLGIVIAAQRSLTMLKCIDLDMPASFNLKLYLSGMFYNLTLPGGIGGDGYRIYFLRKKFKLPTKRLFLAMLFDRLSGLWALVLIAVTLVFFIPKLEVLKHWTILAFIAGTGIYYFILKRFFNDYAKKFVAIHIKSIFIQSLQSLSIICILLSQNFNGQFPPYLFSFSVSTLAANIPISIAGIGTREYVMVNASNFFGMNPTLAIFLTISFFLISTVVALIGLWFIYTAKELKIDDEDQNAGSQNPLGVH